VESVDINPERHRCHSEVISLGNLVFGGAVSPTLMNPRLVRLIEGPCDQELTMTLGAYHGRYWDLGLSVGLGH
jgi:hypothetical protein